MRLFLFGTLRWGALLEVVAGHPVETRPARLMGWAVERAAAGDWPILVPDDEAHGIVTEDLPPEARARLDWYETAFGYGFDRTKVITDDGLLEVDVYRAEGGAGAGVPWDLDAWIEAHGTRTIIAAEEILRGRGRLDAAAIQQRRGIIQARAQSVADGQATRRSVSVGTTFGRQDVDVRRVDYPYDGFHRVEEWHLDHKRFDGTRSGVIQRAISHVADATTVLPYDPVRDRVLLVEQVRVGPLAKGDPLPWLLEPVAGLIDAGETPQSTAIRELEEEAGLVVDDTALRFVGRYYPSPGAIAQVLHSYVALCDLPDGAAGLGGLETEAEDIRAHLVSFDGLQTMVASGEAANAPLILSAQWLALERGTLRADL